MLADRVKEIGASPTMMVAAEAKKLKSEGIDVIDLSMGEPDFHTPNNIKDAGISAIEENKTRYTLNQGTNELRIAISAKLKRDNALEYNFNEIIVSSGAKQSVYNSILVIVNPGDEVIIPAPYWVSYPAMVSLAGGKSVIVQTDESTGFKVTSAQLNSAITSKTKMIILCNPSNPTGSAYTRKELEDLAEVVLKYGIYVLSDEIYEKLVYDDFNFTSFASLGSEIKNKTIIVNGISKTYAMTGWRIGYTAAPENIISAINKIQSHTTSHASSISQHAAIEAIAGPQYVINDMLNEFKKRREYFYNGLISICGITCYKPIGAFYLFPNISRLFHKRSDVLKVENSFDFSMYLLYDAHIAAVPGSAFGSEGYLRLSYSTSMEHLHEAIYRLKKSLSKIQ
ncbi:MAG: pyridoxal phosphate-dependent aminotransferase [Ignavibacteriaceae bacterium]